MDRSRKRLGIAIAIVAVVVLAVIFIVSSGGSGAGADPTGDVTLERGPKAPKDQALADVVNAAVSRDGDRLVFEAELAMEPPRTLPNGSLELRWDISEDGEASWIVTASITVDLTAAVTAQATGYSATTINDTMPGEVSLDGKRVLVSIDPGRIDGFPDAFEWQLSSTLDADLGDPGSGVARDVSPAQDPERFED